MATAGQNAATPPMGVNPFGGNEPPASTCLNDPNFATICSFIQNFGEIIRIGRIPFDELQQMLENTADGKEIGGDNTYSRCLCFFFNV